MTYSEIKNQAKALKNRHIELEKAMEDLKDREYSAILDRGYFFIEGLNNKSCVVNICKKTYGEPIIYFSTTKVTDNEYAVKCTMEVNKAILNITNEKQAMSFLHGANGHYDGLVNRLDCPNLYAENGVSIIDTTNSQTVTTIQWIVNCSVEECSWITDAILNNKLTIR